MIFPEVFLILSPKADKNLVSFLPYFLSYPIRARLNHDLLASTKTWHLWLTQPHQVPGTRILSLPPERLLLMF